MEKVISIVLAAMFTAVAADLLAILVLLVACITLAIKAGMQTFQSHKKSV